MSPLALTAAVLAGCLGALWLLSLRLKDSSIVDLFWGFGFALVAWVCVPSSPGGPRAWLVTALVSLWGLRLTAYLAWRNLGRGEDRRYTAMRERHGAAWPVRSLVIVFGLQGALLWFISLPVQHAVLAGGDVGPVEFVATLLVLFGVGFESLGDLQLARFKADPANRGLVMRTGLWRYTRHPNYFGDAVVWSGLSLFGLAAGAWWSPASAIVMTFLLVRVSGVALLEQTLSARPGYAEYVASTSAFVPWPPKR